MCWLHLRQSIYISYDWLNIEIVINTLIFSLSPFSLVCAFKKTQKNSNEIKPHFHDYFCFIIFIFEVWKLWDFSECGFAMTCVAIDMQLYFDLFEVFQIFRKLTVLTPLQEQLFSLFLIFSLDLSCCRSLH